MNIIAATGHRPSVLFTENPYSKENKRLLTNFAKKMIKENIPIDDSEIKIIQGCAQGWDQCVGWAAIELGYPLLSAVPFEGMEIKWPKESQEEYKLLLKKSTEVIIVSEGGYSNYKFYLRDKYMVDNANTILALYNGNSKGGTAITVKYANEINKPIINCWDAWLKY